MDSYELAELRIRDTIDALLIKRNHDIYFPRSIFFCLSLSHYRVQSLRLDMEEDETRQSPESARYHLFMGCAWDLVWVWILSLHRLALEGSDGARRHGLPRFLYKVFC